MGLFGLVATCGTFFVGCVDTAGAGVAAAITTGPVGAIVAVKAGMVATTAATISDASAPAGAYERSLLTKEGET